MNQRDREELHRALDEALARTSDDFGRLLDLASRDDLGGMCRLLGEMDDQDVRRLTLGLVCREAERVLTARNAAMN